MHPDILCRKPDRTVIFFPCNERHEPQKMCLAAACTPCHKFDFTSAVPYVFPDIFLKIFFLPEIRKELNPAGKLLRRQETAPL